jgi:hypothetical protein
MKTLRIAYLMSEYTWSEKNIKTIFYDINLHKDPINVNLTVTNLILRYDEAFRIIV